ncbi:DNA-binding response regulator [Allostella sp. ATCC 35155]|nr:DNA-binding response regulator [Stella sp. ATCC 35155]
MSGGETAARILVVDDDGEIRRLLAGFLGRNGFAVATARDAADMEAALAAEMPDLVVLDLVLPGVSGLELCRRIRARSDLPVIMLTARGDDTDRIVGLEVGADDYLPKPFNPRELLARIRAVLRRAGTRDAAAAGRSRLAFAGWVLDPRRRELLDPDGAVVDLTAGEYDLLFALVARPHRVLSREFLLEQSGRLTDPFDRSIDVQVSRLRRKLERGAGEQGLIKTVRGAGYLFQPDVEPF